MTIAYVHTSCLVAIAFDEPGAVEVAARLRKHERLLASDLLESELLAAFSREGVGQELAAPLLKAVGRVRPDRAISEELQQVLAVGHLRGADLWHVACALYLAPRPDDLVFETLDVRQRQVAAKVGFCS